MKLMPSPAFTAQTRRLVHGGSMTTCCNLDIYADKLINQLTEKKDVYEGEEA